MDGWRRDHDLDMFNNALKARWTDCATNCRRCRISPPQTRFSRKVRARVGTFDVNRQVFWRLHGRTNRIGGPRMAADAEQKSGIQPCGDPAGSRKAPPRHTSTLLF